MRRFEELKAVAVSRGIEPASKAEYMTEMQLGQLEEAVSGAVQKAVNESKQRHLKEKDDGKDKQESEREKDQAHDSSK